MTWAALDRAAADLPRCGICACACTLSEPGSDVLQCVGCGDARLISSAAAWLRVHHVEERYMRCADRPAGALRAALRAELDREAALAKARFLERGRRRRVPEWLRRIERGAAS